MDINKTRQRNFTNILLIVGSIAFSGILILIILAAFPQLRPDTIVFSVKMGDIFFNHADWVERPDNPDEVLSIHRLVWDEDGFRIPAKTYDVYQVLALGDSYTEAANVALPWPDVLAESGDLSVRNLGFRGYGPVEESFILTQYLSETTEIVVVGFFEGNDLDNVVTSQGKDVTLPSEAESFEIIPTDLNEIDQSNTRYPMTLELSSGQTPMAFFEWYIWNLNVTRNILRNSRNLDLLRIELEHLKETSTNTCLIVAYFPSKPHIYLPYLSESSQSVLMTNTHRRTLDSDNSLITVPVSGLTFERLVSRLSNQRDVVKDLVEDLDIVFFDLTPVLQERASSGDVLYYTYDTHWNQDGHDVVGNALVEYLQMNVCNKDSQ